MWDSSMSDEATPPAADVFGRFDEGMRVRREVLGDEYVDRAVSQQTEFDAPFQQLITEMAWGTVWARPDLDRQTRSLITIAILAALGRREQLETHLRATRNTGATPEQIREALLHVAIYAGVPAANSAMSLAKTVLESASDPKRDGDDRR